MNSLSLPCNPRERSSMVPAPPPQAPKCMETVFYHPYPISTVGTPRPTLRGFVSPQRRFSHPGVSLAPNGSFDLVRNGRPIASRSTWNNI
ncbi:hypothetical protein BD410DRAFT_796332 [Rickenella mellea]|uniref:Uncharacterized protein n=1 Tax=Rickenella mellea TaxID=50990 RepID=A0A4Y7PJG9_9AGAM|nr:hypothetical protein BD410DRAFT_796332 [Rickenella mellea]